MLLRTIVPRFCVGVLSFLLDIHLHLRGEPLGHVMLLGTCVWSCEEPDCFPKQLQCPTFPPAAYEGFGFPTSLPTPVVICVRDKHPKMHVEGDLAVIWIWIWLMVNDTERLVTVLLAVVCVSFLGKRSMQILSPF